VRLLVVFVGVVVRFNASRFALGLTMMVVLVVVFMVVLVVLPFDAVVVPLVESAMMGQTHRI